MKSRYDLVVIGAGAAGLSAAQYGARANLDTLVLEELAPGGQSLLIDSLENYPGLAEPVNGYAFTEAMRLQAERFGAEIRSESAVSLEKRGKLFSIDTGGASIEAGAVILATGAKHRHVDVPGEEKFQGRGVSYCATCDGPFFKGKRMLVVGGGDAACDEAMYLSKLASGIIMVHRKPLFRAQKSLAERVLSNGKIEVRFDTVVVEIKGSRVVEGVTLESLATGERREEAVSAVFAFVGSIPQSSLAPESCRDETGYVVTDERMETGLPGLFAAGDVRVTPFRQIVTAASDGAIAAHAASQYLDELGGKAYR